MGVYINMEMPKSCTVCPFENYGDCYGGKVKAIMDIDDYVYDGKRHPRCPLVNVPEHGDLIDRAALRESFRESIEACHKWADEMREAENEEMVIRAEQSLGTFVECSLRAKAAPAVIPASDKDINVLCKKDGET